MFALLDLTFAAPATMPAALDGRRKRSVCRLLSPPFISPCCCSTFHAASRAHHVATLKLSSRACSLRDDCCGGSFVRRLGCSSGAAYGAACQRAGCETSLAPIFISQKRSNEGQEQSSFVTPFRRIGVVDAANHALPLGLGSWLLAATRVRVRSLSNVLAVKF